MSKDKPFEIKENPFQNWNFKKHLCFVASVYAAVGTISNLFCFTRCAYKEQKRINTASGLRGIVLKKDRTKIRRNFAKNYVKHPPHGFRVLNTILAVCCIFDISAYPLLKKTLEKIDRMV